MLRIDDFQKIAGFLIENKYDNDIIITLNVHSKELLNKFNEEFFYYNNQEGTPDVVEEVDLNVNGVNFKIICDE